MLVFSHGMQFVIVWAWLLSYSGDGASMDCLAGWPLRLGSFLVLA